MSVTTEEKAQQIFIRLGEFDGEKHILQCLYLVIFDLNLYEYWNNVLTAFHALKNKIN
jgi:hypothetical protein